MAAINQPVQTKPTSPAVGYYKFYPKADGFYMLDENGLESKIGGQSIFGSQQQDTENVVQMQLSTLTPTTYITLVTPNLPIGTYRVGYNFSWSYDDVNGNAAHFAVYDNAIRHNTTDITMETKNVFDIAHIGSFLYLDNIQGVHTLELKANCDDIADTVTIHNAYFEIWRVK